MFFGLRRFHALPFGFMRFHYTPIHCFGTLLGCNLGFRSHFRDGTGWYLARHGWCQMSFQLSPRCFENFFVFFVILIDKVFSSQSSGIVALRFLFCSFLFCSILSSFSYLRPNFWPYMIWSGTVQRKTSSVLIPAARNIEFESCT